MPVPQNERQPQRRDAGPGILLARPFGIPVYVSPYWFVIAGVFIFVYAKDLAATLHGSTRFVVAAAFVVLLYLSVLVHELSHSVVALGYGLPVRRILLYPLGGFSEIEREPQTPAREFLVSAAGPALSLVLAAGGYGLTHVVRAGTIGGTLVSQLMWANLIVGVFNLLPGLPLDGGRMLRAAIWKVTGRPATSTIAAAWAGRVLALGLFVLVLAPPVEARIGGDMYTRGVAGGDRRLHVDRQPGRPSRRPGSASGCPGCRPAGWPARRCRSPPTPRWPRRSGAQTRTRPGRWWSSTTTTSRSRSSTRRP